MATKRDVAMVGDKLIVTLEIPLKGGKIEIKGIPPVAKEDLGKLPIKSMTSLDGICIFRYQGSYCVVIQFMGSYYQYCF